jgi:hypothetical protein
MVMLQPLFPCGKILPPSMGLEVQWTLELVYMWQREKFLPVPGIEPESSSLQLVTSLTKLRRKMMLCT